jgi:hypothetical protein
MPELAVLSIALGLLIAVARGPMVVAPRATLAAYRRVLETDVRVRMLGVGLASLGLGLIVFARGSDAGAARFLFAFGWLLAAIAALFGLILTSLFRRSASSFLDFVDDSVDSAALRITGVVALGVATFFIYLGVRVLDS